MSLRDDARRIFRNALEAADAANAVRRHLHRTADILRAGTQSFDLNQYEHVYLLAIGKAAVPMAQAIQTILGDALNEILIITKHGHSAGFTGQLVIESGHPVPDEAGAQAAERVRDFAARCTARDLLLVAISGGASALLPAPAPPLTLADKQQTTSLLLRAGADIQKLNAVRKHLSFLKGGRLAVLAYPATTVALLLSDVIGDAIDVIGSGPTAPDASTFADALAVLDRFALRGRVPASVREHLERGAAGAIPETPKPGDSVFHNVHNVIVGSNRLALQAAAQEARRLGYVTEILQRALEGEAREAALPCVERLRNAKQPACLLAGGETIVTVRGTGKGGRNQEFALAAALAIQNWQNVAVLSAGTDGTDGPTDAAGAIVTGDTIARAQRLGLNAQQYLEDNDSYSFFDALGDLVKTGPTGTNVMDVCILLARNHTAGS